MENTLNIQLKVTDKQMMQLLEGKVDSLPDEKVQEIFSEALKEFLKTPTGQNLFYEKRYYDSSPHPTRFLEAMISNAVSKELLQPVVDELLTTLKDNYQTLLRDAMVNVFSGLFLDNIRQEQISRAINEVEIKLNTKLDKPEN